MLQRNKARKLHNMAKIVYKGRERLLFKEDTLENLEESIEKMSNEQKKQDGKMVLEYIMNGMMIKLESKKILLFSQMYYKGRVEPTWIIENNNELYSLLKNLVLS